MSVHETTVDPEILVEVNVDEVTHDRFLMIESVKVDNLTVESSIRASVNVESEVLSFVHLDLVGEFECPLQSPA